MTKRHLFAAVIVVLFMIVLALSIMVDLEDLVSKAWPKMALDETGKPVDDIEQRPVQELIETGEFKTFIDSLDQFDSKIYQLWKIHQDQRDTISLMNQVTDDGHSFRRSVADPDVSYLIFEAIEFMNEMLHEVRRNNRNAFDLKRREFKRVYQQLLNINHSDLNEG